MNNALTFPGSLDENGHFVRQYSAGCGEPVTFPVPVSERHPDGTDSMSPFESNLIADIHLERLNPADIRITQVNRRIESSQSYSTLYVGGLDEAKALIAALQEVIDLCEIGVGGG